MTSTPKENPEKLWQALDAEVLNEITADILMGINREDDDEWDLEDLECFEAISSPEAIHGEWNEFACAVLMSNLIKEYEITQSFASGHILYFLELRERLSDEKQRELDAVMKTVGTRSAFFLSKESIEALLWRKVMLVGNDSPEDEEALQEKQKQVLENLKKSKTTYLKHEVTSRESQPVDTVKLLLMGKQEEVQAALQNRAIMNEVMALHLSNEKVNPSTHPLPYLYLVSRDLELAVLCLIAKQHLNHPEDEAFNAALLDELHAVEEAFRSIQPGMYTDSPGSYILGVKRALANAQRLKDLLG